MDAQKTPPSTIPDTVASPPELSGSSDDEREPTRRNFSQLNRKRNRSPTGYDAGSTSKRVNLTDVVNDDKVGASVGPRCFRISGIPPNWKESNLLNALQGIDPSLQDREYQLSLHPACCGPTQTALLNLKSLSEYFNNIKELKHELVSDTVNKAKVYLVLDCNMFGLTPLNTPEAETVADIIAITGLAGYAFGSWRSRVTRSMWLKDFLPQDISRIRILTYGYNTNLVKHIVDEDLLDHQRRFVQELQNARSTPEGRSRPIIFIAHSVGGVLLVQALLYCKNGSGGQYKHIFDLTRLVFFFGTPHQGLEGYELLSMVEDISPGPNPRSDLIKRLVEDSGKLREDMIYLWDEPGLDFRIFSFYETEETSTVRKSQSGTWDDCGEKVKMVKKNSALLFLPFEDRIPVQKNHRELTKMDSRVDGTYQTVVERMNAFVNKIVESQEREKKEAEHILTLEILNWLHVASPGDRHNDIKGKRTMDVGEWILETPEFCRWSMEGETSSPLIWAHRIAGAGKTYLSSIVIDHLFDSKNTVAYIYFDYNNQEHQKASDVLASLIHQLLKQLSGLPAPLETLYRKPRNSILVRTSIPSNTSTDKQLMQNYTGILDYTVGMVAAALSPTNLVCWPRKKVAMHVWTVWYSLWIQTVGITWFSTVLHSILYQFVLLRGLLYREMEKEIPQRKPTYEELYDTLLELSKSFTRTFIIFDALDECDRLQRGRLLSMCHRLGEGGFRVFIASRPHPDDIGDSLSDGPKIEVTAQTKDLRIYINHCIDANPRARGLLNSRANDRKDQIVDGLVDAASGMFLFISLNIDYLCAQPTIRCILDEIEKLKNAQTSKKSLDPTYDRIIEGIKKQEENNKTLALNVLSWLTKARRIFRIKELQDAVAVEPQKCVDRSSAEGVPIAGGARCRDLVSVVE
ncbi:hypothetical protein BDD12DRAFT_982128, partial [Trichophaea hybrida]